MSYLPELFATLEDHRRKDTILVPEERNETPSFSKNEILPLVTMAKYKLPKITTTNIPEFVKKTGIFCQIVCQIIFLTHWAEFCQKNIGGAMS